MYQTALELAQACELHLLILLDYAWQRQPHQELERQVASADFTYQPRPSVYEISGWNCIWLRGVAEELVYANEIGFWNRKPTIKCGMPR